MKIAKELEVTLINKTKYIALFTIGKYAVIPNVVDDFYQPLSLYFF